MRLVTYSVFGQEKVGIHSDEGLIDLKFGCNRYFDSVSSAIFSDMRTFLASGATGLRLAKEIVQTVLERESKVERSASDLLDSCILRSGYKLRPPVTRPDKILCPAVNYVEHGKESSVSPPSEPYFFGKFVNALIGQDDTIMIPSITKMPDYEVELAAIIGKKGKHIKKNQVDEFIAGYTVLNDVSFRDLQGWPKGHPTYGPHWLMGKDADTACPVGPWIVTTDELPSPYPSRIKLAINGSTRQDSNTSNQIFKIPELVAYLSQIMTLEPGDVISTGTPSGVGRTTGTYLKEGDVIEAEIEKIGILRNFVRNE